MRTLAELLTLVKSDPGSLTPGELKFIRAELAKLDESKEPEKPGRLIPQSRDPLAQVLEWILAGAGERDLREAIAATFPDQNGNALILSALRGLEKSAEVWSAQAMGFCYEASRELYRRMVEIGDFPGALRAVKMIADLSKIGRNGMDRLADDIEDMLTVKASEVK